MRWGGAQGSENVGMSNRNVREIRTHRKSKVSRATAIVPGLVGPKARPKSVVDGKQVNIPALLDAFDGVTHSSILRALLDLRSFREGVSLVNPGSINPSDETTVRNTE